MARVNKGLIYLSGVLMLTLTLLANVQIVYRYFLELPLPWVEEVIRYLMIYMVFIMSAVAIYTRSHLNLDVIDILLGDRMIRVIERIRLIFIFLFCVYFTYLSFILIKDTIKLGQVTPALQISMAVPLTALLVGSLFMAANAFVLLWGSKPSNISNDISQF